MAKPIVAIVGKPNVGKSTLFNRIARQRIAIVQDEPGVTRDRLYCDVEWLNNHFTLIDTGGIDIGEDIITRQVREQAQIAIEEADVIVFVVDGREGLTAADEDVANVLRKTDKKVILCVNKIDDHLAAEAHVWEFYALGLGDPVAVSAEHGRNIGDLLDQIVVALPKVSETEDEDLLKLAIVGRPNVGKSSLVNKFLGENRVIVSDIPGTTRDAIDTYFTRGEQKYLLIDTAGLRRRKKIEEEVERYSVIRTLRAIDRSDIAILMLDATEGLTEQDKKIAGYAHEGGKGMIIVVNKWDLVEKDSNTMRDFEQEIRAGLQFLSYAPIVFISALTGQRVHQVLDLADQVSEYQNLRISTGRLNTLIQDAVAMNQAPSDKGVRLKIYYVTQAQVKPPVFLIYVNYKELMHFSYLRYLENQIREEYEFIGTPIILSVKERQGND
ncbi:MAG: ribosome biogenesis GTPase Der [Firmicutes bacterium]|nr:ribosome biogenesis GTPase Der [Bacillota bacterium]